MITEARTILGIFSDKFDANNALAELEDLGLDVKNISIVAKDLEWTREAQSGKGVQVAKGAATGAGTGAALGALTGLLVGLGTIAIPGIGALFIGGPLAAALGLTGAAATAVSAAASGVVAGGLLGALAGLGLPREVAEVYEEKVRQGAVVLAVNVYTLEDEEDVKTTYRRNAAEHIQIVEPKEVYKKADDEKHSHIRQ